MRLLGGGAGLPDLAAANDLGPPGASGPPPWLTVGFDVLGGRFAVSGGGLPGRRVRCATGDLLFTAESHP